MVQHGLKAYRLTILVSLLLLLASCENSIKQIQQISAQEMSKPVDATTGVDVIYSDSGVVKARMLTPLLLEYQGKKPYDEMPKGVKIISFDRSLKVSCTITADTAFMREGRKLIELRKNVKVVNADGDIFMSDELIWNQITNKVTSNKPVTMTSPDGRVARGNHLVTNGSFAPWSLENTTAEIPVSQNLSQQ